MSLSPAAPSNAHRLSLDLLALGPSTSRLSCSPGDNSTLGQRSSGYEMVSNPNEYDFDLERSVSRASVISDSGVDLLDRGALSPSRGTIREGGRMSAYHRLTQRFHSHKSHATESDSALAPSQGGEPLPATSARSVLPSHLTPSATAQDSLVPFPSSPSTPKPQLVASSHADTNHLIVPDSPINKTLQAQAVAHAEEERARRQWLKKHAWFKTPPGQHCRDRDHRLRVEELPYWRGYGLAGADYDAFVLEHWLLELAGRPSPRAQTPSVEVDSPFDEPGPEWPTAARWPEGHAPGRVLDLGCGIHATWILKALKSFPESTTFVGLDAMPVLLTPSMLSPSESKRVTFVQQNFLLGPALPFEEGSFDLIRMSLVGSGVPEHQWERLVSRVMRLLSPEGKLEVVETQLEAVLGPLSGGQAAVEEMSAAAKLLRDLLTGIADRRFLNLAHFSVIKPTLAIYAGKSSVTLNQSVEYPSPHALDPALGSKEDWKVLTARIVGPFIRARSEFFIDEYLINLSLPDDGRTLPLLHPPAGKEDCRAALSGFAGMLDEGLPVAELLGERWGWECAMDRRAADLLESNLLQLREDEVELEAEKAKFETIGLAALDEDEDERILARAQVASSLREAEAERGKVKQRLNGGNVGKGERKVKGSMGLQSWIASPPSAI